MYFSKENKKGLFVNYATFRATIFFAKMQVFKNIPEVLECYLLYCINSSGDSNF